MNRKRLPWSKVSTILMFVFLVAFIILFIVFFNVADGFKAAYDADSIKYVANTTSVADKLAIRAEMAIIGQNYTTFSVMSYAFSILAIIALGGGLWVTDKIKEAEEKAAENE